MTAAAEKRKSKNYATTNNYKVKPDKATTDNEPTVITTTRSVVQGIDSSLTSFRFVECYRVSYQAAANGNNFYKAKKKKEINI